MLLDYGFLQSWVPRLSASLCSVHSTNISLGSTNIKWRLASSTTWMFHRPILIDQSYWFRFSNVKIKINCEMPITIYFPEPKMTSLDCFFCPTKWPKSKDSSFTVENAKEKQHILTLQKLESTKWLKQSISCGYRQSFSVDQLID